jgi:gluconate 2-dehydrogenase gamma chain
MENSNDRVGATLGRRSLLKILSAAPVAASFALTEAEAQEAHNHAAAARQTAQQTGAAFTPKFFTPAEYQTVRILSDLIIPADDRSGGAIDAGVPEFMDFTMVDQPARQVAMRGGLAWLDLECQKRFDKTFVGASDAQRTAVLDDLATHGELKPGLSHGQAFFRAFRDLTASGFWTTKVGMTDLGYMGNTVVPKWDGCPPEQLKKLGLA